MSCGVCQVLSRLAFQRKAFLLMRLVADPPLVRPSTRSPTAAPPGTSSLRACRSPDSRNFSLLLAA